MPPNPRNDTSARHQGRLPDMPRPRKPEGELRSRTIGVRVNTAEAAEIAERAGAARMTTGGYMRRRALGQPVRELVVLRLGAKERVELHRIGVNLNQIARALNSGASAPDGTLEAVERVGELAAGLLSGEALDR
ncbi:MAG: MobC family plasmid mobilization relaxosome protein [Gemmatimonadales bacterium]|nr:MobC family plasmid mobilization relaxosome protein [Candidatus Palauibacter irciniicola]